MNSEKPEVIQNLFTLMESVSSPDTLGYFNDKWNTCEIRYGDMKKQLAQDICATVAPIREKINAFMADDDYLQKVAAMGAERARESAAKTIREVREIIGFRN